MIQKIYNISGFDCANCAAKTEAHLNRHDDIAYCRIDFAMNKLYISYKEKELSISELLKIISEVESDEITITESDVKIKKNIFFSKKNIYLLVRVLIAVIIMIICSTAFKDKQTYYWVQFGLYLGGVILLSYDVIYKVINHIIHLENPIDEYLLITIAVAGAFTLAALEPEEGFLEALMVVTLFQAGRVIEGIATNKSKQAIMSAVDSRAEFATLITEEGTKQVAPEELKINDVVLLKVGEAIPTDGIVIEGEGYIDTSSLTGEYIPTAASKDSEIYAGCIIKSGSLKMTVTKEYKDSTVAKINELISTSGEKKSKADKFITKFARIYTPCVLLISILYILISGLVTKEWKTSTYTGLEFLVVACPCAIVISVPLACFSAIGLGSKHGIVIKGTNYLDELVKVKKLITDKTGTLTHGAFSIQKTVAVNCSDEELLEIIIAGECRSTHPIGKAICHGKNTNKISANLKEYNEIAGFGIIAKYNKSHILVGSSKLLQKYKIEYSEANEFGTIIYAAKNGKYLGYIVLSDTIKEDAQPMVDLLHHIGVEIVLLTGDKEDSAKEICNQLGIDRWHSELLPEDKVKILEIEMENTKGNVAFIGDGINDAASIRQSDVGIAMGGIGSDLAVQNADVVIMNDDPAKVYDAIKISKMSRNTSIFNICFSLAIKIIVVILCAVIKNSSMMIWAVLADTGLTVLMVINSLILLYRPVSRKMK